MTTAKTTAKTFQELAEAAHTRGLAALRDAEPGVAALDLPTAEGGYLRLFDAAPVFLAIAKLNAELGLPKRGAPALTWPGVVLRHTFGRTVAVLSGPGGPDPLESACWDDYEQMSEADRKDTGFRLGDLVRMRVCRELRARIRAFELERVELPRPFAYRACFGGR